MNERENIKRIIKIWASVIVILILVGYGTYRAKDFVHGPDVIIEYPQNGQTSFDSYVEIKGTAKNLSFLTLNGDKIFTDENGVWIENILLSPGYNVIQLKAEDRFKRTKTETLELIYKPHGIQEKN